MSASDDQDAGRTARHAGSGVLSPIGIEWQLVEVRKGPGDVIGALDREVVLRFDGNGEATGTDGCNRFRSSVIFRRGRVLFGTWRSTAAACPEAAQVAAAVGSIQNGEVQWRIQDRVMTLEKVGIGTLTYRVRPSIYPSDRPGSAYRVLVQGQDAGADYRVSYAVDEALRLLVEARDAPGYPWATTMTSHSLDRFSQQLDPMAISIVTLRSDRILAGIVTAEAHRVSVRNSAGTASIDLPLIDLDRVTALKVFVGFVEAPARGSVITIYRGDGSQLGPPLTLTSSER